MHLWPSVRLRDSFKIAYLRKLEWNLHRMKSEKQSSSSSPKASNNQQSLLNDQEPADLSSAPSKFCASFVVICREFFMLLACCHCCFCCGACIDEEDN